MGLPDNQVRRAELALGETRFDTHTDRSVQGSLNQMGSVQNLSHFQSCDGGSVILMVHLAQRLHVHILSRAPLRAGDVFQPGRSQAETGLTIGKRPNDPGPSSNFLHQPLQRIVRPDFAPKIMQQHQSEDNKHVITSSNLCRIITSE